MRIISLALLSLLLNHCGSSDDSTGTSATFTLSAPLPNGSNVGVYLTDRRTTQTTYSSVHVLVSGVDLIPQNSGDTGKQEVALATPLDIDLLSLQNKKTQLLGGVLLSAGLYQQLRLKLNENPASGDPYNYVTLAGSDTKYPLQTPSAVKSGIKITGLNLQVTEKGQFAIVLDFDAAKSVVVAGEKYLLKPVIQAKIGPITDSKVETKDTGASDPNQK